MLIFIIAEYSLELVHLADEVGAYSEGKNSFSPRHSIAAKDSSAYVEKYMNSFKSLLETSDNIGDDRLAGAEHKQQAAHLRSEATTHLPRKIHSRVSFDVSSAAVDIDSSPSTSTQPDSTGVRKPREPAFSADDEENSARVDALLLELFPERFHQKQPTKTGKSKPSTIAKKSGQGFSRNQVSVVQVVVVLC